MSTYCFSDLHAQYDLWLQIKEFIKPNDVVYCLGDCIDRGDAGLEILTEVMNTPNTILLRGNHEDFISDYGYEIINNNMSSDFYLWYLNGGEKTIEAFSRLSTIEQIDLIKEIRKLPTHIKYINTNNEIIYLCHAGRQPDTKEMNILYKNGSPMNNYVWDRSHLRDSSWRGKENEYCVHGHTPIEYIYEFINLYYDEVPKSEYEIYKYCGGHKINIDLGSFDTHIACLLNLDTLEPIYFKDRTFNEEENSLLVF